MQADVRLMGAPNIEQRPFIPICALDDACHALLSNTTMSWCVRIVQVDIRGRFAFVEFSRAQYATYVLQLNGQLRLAATTLKIERPTSYVE